MDIGKMVSEFSWRERFCTKFSWGCGDRI